MTASDFTQAEERVRLFEKEVADEPWKRDHEEAMACLSFQATLKFGIDVYDLLIRTDEVLRGEWLSGRRPYDPKVEQAIQDLFRWWLAPCERVEATLKVFERKKFAVDYAVEFRKRHDEAVWMQKSAKEAFAHPKVANLRDEALDEIRGAS